MNLVLDRMKVEEYYRKPKEKDLHAPFADFAATLLGALVSGLEELNGSAETLTSGFWDAKGDQEIKHDGRGRKPDMAVISQSQMPVSDDVVPEWTVVKHVYEFKHDDYKKKGPSLPSLPAKTKARVKQGWNTGSADSPTLKGNTTRIINSERPAAPSEESMATSWTNPTRKRLRDSGSENGPDSKRTRLTAKKSQLGQYAIECLAATSRRWVTGLLIDTTIVTACYFDRHMVVSTSPFRFDQHPERLALLLYAMDICDKDRAGFDPHLVPRLSVPDLELSGDAKDTKEQPDLSLPVSDIIGSYFEFPAQPSEHPSAMDDPAKGFKELLDDCEEEVGGR